VIIQLFFSDAKQSSQQSISPKNQDLAINCHCKPSEKVMAMLSDFDCHNRSNYCRDSTPESFRFDRSKRVQIPRNGPDHKNVPEPSELIDRRESPACYAIMPAIIEIVRRKMDIVDCPWLLVLRDIVPNSGIMKSTIC